eukprot:TRINITY_DN21551_c0_g2_i1.p1 TRINITY_DN21551_c0_g2~~TRINITY_DN21551_c0_g2_i1.p1  ORF type:complete len:594 (-),score=129.96 TRINITY_DN21551_c0_g2_i1:132-1841(-)
MSTLDIAPPPPKRARMTTSEFLRARRQGAGGGIAPKEELLSQPTGDMGALAEIPEAEMPSITVEGLQEAFAGKAEDLSGANHAKKVAQHTSASVQQRAKEFEQKARQPLVDAPKLTSSEDIASDLTLRRALKVATPHSSLKWLRRIPAALRCQSLRSQDLSKGHVRDAALQLCETSLPNLLSDPDKAVAWLARIAACLSWHEVDGPPLPASFERPVERDSSSHLASADAAKRALQQEARRKVEDWDEAYRSLWLLLRQGTIPSYAIVADRFSLMVFGEGSGSWTSPSTGEPVKPSQAEPCAVLWPSSYQLRSLLQANHVHFEMMIADVAQEAPATTSSSSPKAVDDGALVAVSSFGGSALVVPGGVDGAADEMTTAVAELRALRRDGETVTAPEDAAGSLSIPSSSALFFKGKWRVHALIDVLRRYLLGHPLPGAEKTPNKLPVLLAPGPFVNAAAKSAEVVKTQTVSAASASAQSGAGVNDAGTGTGGTGDIHCSAELNGVFFPSQVRRLMELLRVLLPSFSCEFPNAPKHGVGTNVFTQLGARRIEAVSCEGTGNPSKWKWDFRVGS